MSGYVRLHRSLLGHPAFRNDGEALAFAWMIARASWKPCRLRYKGRPVSLKRGQLCVSQRDMAAAIGQDKTWIERLWKRLIREAMIEATREAAAMVITICNYDKYQHSSDECEAVDEAQPTPPFEADARQTRGTEQGREIREEISVAKATSPRATRLAADWVPKRPYPDAVQELVDGWPEKREARELDGFRDYWAARKRDAARLDWDKTWHNRIRDQHDRIMRESRNGQRNGNSTPGIGRTEGAALSFLGIDPREAARPETDPARASGNGGHSGAIGPCIEN